MRILVFLSLFASLAVNATLGYLMVASRGNRSDSGAAAVSTAKTDTVGTTNSETWAALAAGDDRALAERLRASGFPPSVVRAVLRARIAEQYEARIKAISDADANRPFWKSGLFDPEQQKALREISREQRDALKQLLGPDPDERGSQAMAAENAYLTPQKSEALRDLLQKFGDKREELFSNGVYDRAKIQALDKEQHDAVAGLLSPTELFEYDVRNSRTAATLREQLAGFNPTEEEFRAIFKLQQPYDDRYSISNIGPTVDPQEMRLRMDAQKQLLTDIKAALSPDRAAVYDKLTDYNYAQTAKLVARLELPAQTADALYDLQKEFDQRRRDLFSSGRAGSRDEMMAQSKAMQEEALAKAAQLLGSPDAVEAYKQYGGRWLQSLVPNFRPARPSPAAAVPKS